MFARVMRNKCFSLKHPFLMNSMDFSIVIPFYNEEENVETVLVQISKVLDQNQVDYEIIAVNNNSSDRTGSIIKELVNNRHHVRQVFVKERGYGNAVRGGLRVAKGKWIGWIDGDLQILPIDLYNVIKQTKEQNAVFCKAERRIRLDGLSRIVFTHLYRIFVFLFLRQWIFDVNGKPKFFRRKLYEKICTESRGWFFDTELVCYLLRLGANIYNVPITFFPRKKGKSSMSMKTIYQLFKEIIHFLKIPWII